MDCEAVEVTCGLIADAARHAYRYGQCHALALALHDATGWPIQCSVDLSRLADWPAEWGPSIEVDEADGQLYVVDAEALAAGPTGDAWLIDRNAAHSVVAAPSGDVVDITGVIPAERWRAGVGYDLHWRVGVR